MTWLQLWERIGKQPLRLTRNKDVTIKIEGVEYKCKIVYTDSGNNWHLEIKEDMTSNTEDYKCETCVYYPPSSFGGKPCCMCDVNDGLLNCYREKM